MAAPILTLYAGSLNIVTMAAHHSIVPLEMGRLSTMGRSFCHCISLIFHTLCMGGHRCLCVVLLIDSYFVSKGCPMAS